MQHLMKICKKKMLFLDKIIICDQTISKIWDLWITIFLSCNFDQNVYKRGSLGDSKLKGVFG